MFDTVIHIHNIQMERGFILRVVHVVGTRLIESGIDGLSRGNNTGVITQGIYTLKFIPIHLGDL